MTNEFVFIGEHKDDEEHLLVRGADGQYYDYTPDRDHFERVDPDEDEWKILNSSTDADEPREPISPYDIDV